MVQQWFRHIILPQQPDHQEFTSISSGGRKKRIRDQDRQFHSDFLYRKLNRAWSEAENEQAVAHVTRKGVYIEFKSEPGFDLVTQSLENRQSRQNQIRLLNIREKVEIVENGRTGELEPRATTYATVFVPHEKKNQGAIGDGY